MATTGRGDVVRNRAWRRVRNRAWRRGPKQGVATWSETGRGDAVRNKAVTLMETRRGDSIDSEETYK